MIHACLKLRPTEHQERELERWLYHLTAVWNWSVRKLILNSENQVYFHRWEFKGLLDGHSKRIGIPGCILRGTLDTAYQAWTAHRAGISGKPKLKGQRNRLTSISIPIPITQANLNKVSLPYLHAVKFNKQDIPQGSIKGGRLIKRVSGWYLCLFIAAEPKRIEHVADGAIGIDPGFSSLLTLSTGEQVGHPRELEASARRLAQAQRGQRKQLAARLQERIRNQRKDRNHKLSRRLVAENRLIVFSADNHKAVARRFGKSVASSGHSQLRGMLAYKSRAGGRQYIEVDPKYSTMTCSECGCLSGPTGLAGLSVRQWRCTDCGAFHDRDVNAAVNTLLAGAGLALGVLESRSVKIKLSSSTYAFTEVAP